MEVADGSSKKWKCQKYKGKANEHMRNCVYVNNQYSGYNLKELINNSA